MKIQQSTKIDKITDNFFWNITNKIFHSLILNMHYKFLFLNYFLLTIDDKEEFIQEIE